MRALMWSRSLAGLLALSACAGGGDPTGTPVVAGATLAVSVSGLVPLDPAVDRFSAADISAMKLMSGCGEAVGPAPTL